MMKDTIGKVTKSQYFIMIVSIFAIAICSTLATFYIRKAFSWEEVKSSNSYQYETRKNVNYQVNLVQNTFVQQNPQMPDELYIARLIQSIPATFQYQFQGKETGSFEYRYYVQANIVAHYKRTDSESSEAPVWSKKYPLVEEETKVVKNSSSFNVVVPVTIDYNAFANEVATFIRQLALSIDAELQVDLIVETEGTSTSGEAISNSDKVSMVIPLNQDVLQITRDKNVISDSAKQIDTEVVNKMDTTSLIIGIAMFVVAVIFVVVLASELLKRTHKSKYFTEVHKILNDYGEIIVEVIHPLDLEHKEKIMVKNFNEMIDLEQELRVPILCYQDEVLGQTTFAIMKETRCYVYLIRQSEVDQ